MKEIRNEKKGKQHILTFVRQQFKRRLKHVLARTVFFRLPAVGR